MMNVDDEETMFLSQQQFSTISNYASYSPHKLADMRDSFKPPNGIYSRFVSPEDQTIDYEGFSLFINAYIGAELPKDIADSLFLSFVRRKNLTFNERQESPSEAPLSSDLATRDKRVSPSSLLEQRIPLKPLFCYLALLEDANPTEKLEFVFHVYDSDDDQSLAGAEIDCIIEQMLNVARGQQRDTVELEPVLRQMITDIDRDSDGLISLDEWKRVGMTTIPLLVLLGVETEIKEDGSHVWNLQHFDEPTYCNVCQDLLVTWKNKQGLVCALCKFTAHEQCVRRAAANCIRTFSSQLNAPMRHHWIGANRAKKCAKCRRTVAVFRGKRCRWCDRTLHDECLTRWPEKCDLGRLAAHILPPTHLMPAFPDRSSHQLQAITPSGNCQPLLVLINSKSGGKQGEEIRRKMLYLLNPRQVYDLKRDGPEVGLTLFATIATANVLVCGGDGTIGWVLDAMDKIDYGKRRPPVAILPLGTGNDLARCLRWGGGYAGESLRKIIISMEKTKKVELDRWHVQIEPKSAEESGDSPPSHIINNYFSIGVDASIAHRFHVMREKFPEKFNSRIRNKLHYCELFASEVFASTCKNLHEMVTIECDRESVDLRGGPSLEGVAVLNIDSIYGGVNIWRVRKYASVSQRLVVRRGPTSQLSRRAQDIGDGQVEVIGMQSAMHMGQIRVGIRTNARRLAQCSTIVIQTDKELPMQIDGEPWLQPPCTIRITHKNRVPMLVGRIKRSSWHLPKCCTVGE